MGGIARGVLEQRASLFAVQVREKQLFSLAAIQRDMAMIDASCSNASVSRVFLDRLEANPSVACSPHFRVEIIGQKGRVLSVGVLADSLGQMGVSRNLVIVLAHGLRSDALDDSQVWPLHTPNLQKLTELGIRLEAISACPADSGGMGSLLTGLHSRQHGHVDQHDLPQAGEGGGEMIACSGWAARLQEAGYHVAGVGCVGAIESCLTDAVRVGPVNSVDSVRCAYLSNIETKGMGPAIQQQRGKRLRYGPFDPDRLLMDSQDDVDGFIAAKARTMLTQMPSDKPWALIVIFSGPANDLPPPTLFEYIVDPQLLEQGFVPADFTRLDVLAELDYPRIFLQRLEPHQLGRIRADYLGRVSLIDYGIGRLMSATKDRSDHSRIWMVVSSDRGQLLGEHGLVGHRSFLVAAVTVPVLIVPPSPVTQKVAPALLSTIDVAATIAALGGCDLPQALVGRSLLPILHHRSVAPCPWPGVLSEFGKRLMLETERYKVIFNTESFDTIGLYDRLADPDEQTNLVSKPAGADVLDSLRVRLGDMLMPLRALPGGKI